MQYVYNELICEIEDFLFQMNFYMYIQIQNITSKKIHSESCPTPTTNKISQWKKV